MGKRKSLVLLGLANQYRDSSPHPPTRMVQKINLKFRLHRAVKSAGNLSLHRSLCFRKSAASPCKLSTFSLKASPVRHISFCFRKSAFSRCKFKAFSFKTSPVRRRSSPRSYGDEEQSVELERRFETLRTLVPGSHGLDTPILLEKAADYITALKMQVEAMQTLARLLESPGRGTPSWPT
ncbi:hypothetical protein SUGI_0635130 [Cryptomeria japonica]|nr:hypothetical protein SUGI_0635130 [Cryptomeria japonica]